MKRGLTGCVHWNALSKVLFRNLGTVFARQLPGNNRIYMAHIFLGFGFLFSVISGKKCFLRFLFDLIPLNKFFTSTEKKKLLPHECTMSVCTVYFYNGLKEWRHLSLSFA